MTIWHRAALVFIAMVALDIAFALYVIETAGRNPVMASAWAAGIQLCNIFVVSSFVRDRRMSAPSIVGAFVGTYIAIQLF